MNKYQPHIKEEPKALPIYPESPTAYIEQQVGIGLRPSQDNLSDPMSNSREPIGAGSLNSSKFT